MSNIEPPEFTRCSERACPFQVVDAGEVLCRQHRRAFTYDISLEDRSISMAVDTDTHLNADGLHIKQSKWHLDRLVFNRKGPDDYFHRVMRIHHQALGSAAILGTLVKNLTGIGDAGRDRYFGHPLEAEEVFKESRFISGLFCPICGRDDFYPPIFASNRMRHIWACRRCRYQMSATNLTIFADTRRLNYWARGVWQLHQDQERGAIKRLQRELGCSYHTAWEMGLKLYHAGQIIGLKFGAPINRNRKWTYNTITKAIEFNNQQDVDVRLSAF